MSYHINFPYAPNQDARSTTPEPDAIIGVPVGAAKSVPWCNLL
jgi:hypothetical protein